MTVTVTLSENVAERLQAHAAEFHLSLDALVEKLPADALPVVETNGFTRLRMMISSRWRKSLP